MAFVGRIIPVFRSRYGNLRNYVSPTVRNYFGRKDMFSEISSAMQVMDLCMKEMDREMCRVFNEVECSSPLHFPRFLSPFSWRRIRNIPIESTSDDGRKYRLELHIPDMAPEDINMSLKNQTLTILAHREEKKADGSRCVREYNYEYTLPKDVNPTSVKCLFSDGLLMIEALLPELEGASDPQEIPIKLNSNETVESTDGK